MLANIDEHMGLLDTFLRETNLREITIVLFFSDNGGTAGVKNLLADAPHAITLARLRHEFAAWRQATEDRDVHPKLIARRIEN